MHLLEDHAARTPDKAACILSTGERITYRELDERSRRLARALAARGLETGDAVGILMENRLDFLVALWSAHRAGLAYAPINTRLKPGEVDYILEDSRARGLITSTAMAELIGALALPSAVVARLSVGPVAGFDDLDAAIAAESTEPLGRPDGHDLMYSSGTTGRPKGVATAVGGDIAAVLATVHQVTAEDVYLSPAPMYHTAPARTVFSMTRLGVTVVMMEHFDAARFLELVDEHGVTITQVVPTMFVRMLRLPEEQRAAYDLSSLRRILHNAAPCPIPIKEQMIEWVGPILNESYAATEGHGATVVDSHEWLAHKGTVGRAAIGEIHIVDDVGNELPAGSIGTVYFSGGSAFEYRNEPAKTAETRHPKGWTTVGDIGYLDDEGYLYLTDRKANMIISGGMNIYPQETENVLLCHPRVLDAAVFGVPDDDLGEEVKAVVQLVDPTAASDALAAELIAYCRDELAHVKCPRSVDFTDELPREPNGKLLKRLLRDPYWANR